MHELSLGFALPSTLLEELATLKQIVQLLVYFMELENLQLVMHS
jgi:hypothetical protein